MSNNTVPVNTVPVNTVPVNTVPVRRSVHRRTVTTTRYALVVLLALIMVFPLLHLLGASFMAVSDAQATPPPIIPPTWHPENYSQAFEFLSARTISNSFIFTIGILILQLAISLPAGFALAQFKFRGRGVLVALFILPMFLPTNVFVIPLFIVTLKLGLVNSFAGLILPIVGSTAFGTLLFRQFFVNFPPGLIEAARIDGAGWFRLIWFIVLPLVKPAAASYSLMTFVTAWNMYVWPQIVATDANLRVIPVALAPLARSTYSTIPATVGFAAAIISALPVVLIFILFQRWFLNAIQGSGIE